jgi:hypothetical protein
MELEKNPNITVRHFYVTYTTFESSIKMVRSNFPLAWKVDIGRTRKLVQELASMSMSRGT